MNPGALYFAQFAALASTGRFTSVFLASFSFTDSQIGLIMSIPLALSLISVNFGGILADKFPDSKLKIVMFCHVVSCVFFQMLVISVTPPNRLLYICVTYTMSRLFRTPAIPVLDAYTLEYLAKGGGSANKNQFGRVRMWGAVSWGVTSVAVGGFLDYVGFKSLYVLNALMTVLLVVLFSGNLLACYPAQNMGFVLLRGNEMEDLSEREYRLSCAGEAGSDYDDCATEVFEDSDSDVAKSLLEGGRKESVLEFSLILFRNPRSVVFLFTVMCVQVGTSLVGNLVFLFFVQDLKASYFLCGAAVALTATSQVPLFYASERLLGTFGSSPLLLMGMLCYVTRVVVYTLVDSKHVGNVLWVEPLHGVTFSLVKLATVMEMSELAPPHLQATGQSFLNACGTIGTVIGTLGGSYVMQLYGSVVAYRSAAALVTFAAILYGVTTLYYRGKRSFLPRDYKETEVRSRQA